MSEYDSYIRDRSDISRGAAVVVAMSGGVDSSVAAAILSRDGYNVAGVTLKLWCLAEDLGGDRRCCSAQSLDDAGAVCRALGIPHYVLDLRAEFKSSVVEPFCREYLAGRTPNPCVACNTQIKFGALMGKARDMRADFVSTGHHVRQVVVPETGAHRLLRALDPAKDQSYALWGLTQRALRRTLFPIGWLTKDEVRGVARDLGLGVAGKEESQDVCFLPGGDICELLEDVLPGEKRPGDGEIRDLMENAIGRHKGYHNFTIGQRRGLHLARGRRQYIVRLDPGRNVVYVGDDGDLKATAACASGFNLIEGRPATGLPAGPAAKGDGSRGLRVTAKIRYLHPGAPGWLKFTGEDTARVSFDEPQRAITPGQSIVAYDGDTLLGGGFIDRAES